MPGKKKILSQGFRSATAGDVMRPLILPAGIPIPCLYYPGSPTMKGCKKKSM
jgi:hypothetical protein